MHITDFQNGPTRQLNQILNTLKSVHKTDLKLSSRSIESIRKIQENSQRLKNQIINESKFNTYNSNPNYAKHSLIVEATRIYLKEIAPKRKRKHMMNEDTTMPNQPNGPNGTPTPPAQNNAAAPGMVTVQKDNNTKSIPANQLAQYRGQGYSVVADPTKVNEMSVKMTPELAQLMKKYGVSSGTENMTENTSKIKMTPELAQLMKKYGVNETMTNNKTMRKPIKENIKMTPELAQLMKKYGVSSEGTVDEADAFTMAAADAKAKGKSTFRYSGKTYPDTMSAKTAKKIVDEGDMQVTMTPELAQLMKKYGVSEGAQKVNKISESKFKMTPELAQLMKKYGVSENVHESEVSNVDHEKMAKEHLAKAKECRDTNDRDGFTKHCDLANYHNIKCGNKPSKSITNPDRFCKHVETTYSKELNESKIRYNKKILESAGYDDHQASIARSELYRNTKYAMDMIRMIKVGDDIEAWVSANLASAADTLDKIYHHLDYYTKFEPENLPEDLDLSNDEKIVDDDGYSHNQIDNSVDRENLMLIVEYSTKLFNLIQPGDKLEGWVAMKLTTASENISSAKHYLEYAQFEKNAGDVFPKSVEEKKKPIKENIGQMLMKMMINEDQDLEQAQTLLAAKAISDDLQSMAEKVAKMSVEDLMPLVDTMKTQFGLEQAEGYNSIMKAGFDALLQSTTSAKDSSDNAIMQLQQGGIPGQQTDIESTDDEMPGPAAPEDVDDGLDNVPAASGPKDEPLGRSKKDMSENWDKRMNPVSKDKGKWKDYTIAELKAKKSKLMAKDSRSAAEQKEVREIDFAIRAKQDDKWGKINENAPKNPEAEKFIKDNKAEFNKRYGNKGEEILYATAWKKFGNKNESYVKAQAVIEHQKTKMTKLLKMFESHKIKHARQIAEGTVIDPTAVGYGLSGQLILDKIRQVDETISKAKGVIKSELRKGVNSIKESHKINAQIKNITEAKNAAPYGVTWKTKSGRVQRKFFESKDLRTMWVNLKRNTILNEVKLIEPSDFDNQISKLSKKKV